ncbi:hypothetical protein WR25_04508 [Diploscapter pachys]|uniref:F-BAR domain-containing protein n=1 Tax=Diploscapter pachys TaxID=2018661 RepID=A0A2A2LG66_9BILA|nr:hypothetical protein WR25_04508 [Diploscapter pachys]
MGHLDGSVLQYSNHFWGDKHHGFQVLYENTKKGEESAQELSIFIKERLQLEDEYSKMLVKSMNKVSSFVSSGSALETVWVLTKGTLELLAEIHVMMVKNLQDLSREIVKYKDEVSKSRKEAKQQPTIEAVNLMQTTTTCLQKAKETYYARCNEYEKVRKEANANPKEIAKVCAQYRESMLTMNIDDILRKIVESKGTGTERPPPATFEECETMLAHEDLMIPLSGRHSPSQPSSSTSSAVIQNPAPPQVPTANDLLLLDHFELFSSNGSKSVAQNTEAQALSEKTPMQPSPTASHSSDSTAGTGLHKESASQQNQQQVGF